MKIRGKQGDVVFGILSVIFGIAILILNKVQGLELVKQERMGPGFFPTICGMAIILCGILLLIEVLWKKKTTSDDEKEDNIVNVQELKNLLLFVILGGMVLVLSDVLGLLTCLDICVVVYLKIQGKESWVKSIIIGLGMMAFLYVVFVLFLHVPVPKGVLGF